MGKLDRGCVVHLLGQGVFQLSYNLQQLRQRFTVQRRPGRMVVATAAQCPHDIADLHRRLAAQGNLPLAWLPAWLDHGGDQHTVDRYMWSVFKLRDIQHRLDRPNAKVWHYH